MSAPGCNLPPLSLPQAVVPFPRTHAHLQMQKINTAFLPTYTWTCISEATQLCLSVLPFVFPFHAVDEAGGWSLTVGLSCSRSQYIGFIYMYIYICIFTVFFFSIGACGRSSYLLNDFISVCSYLKVMKHCKMLLLKCSIDPITCH